MPDPSLLVSVPSISEPALAPDGGSVVYALEPVPNLTGRVDWAGERGRAEDSLRAALDGLGYPVADVVTSRLVDPVDWARDGLVAGTPFSISHRFFQSGPFRPSNVERRAPGTGVRRLRYGAGHRRTDGARVGATGRRPRSSKGRDSVIDAEVPAGLEAAYAQCRELTRRHGTTYYWATQLLPRRSRPHVYALYGFCRYADDIVDDLDDQPTANAGRRRWPTSAIVCGSRWPGRRSTRSPIRSWPPSPARPVSYDIGPDCFERFLRSMTMDLTVAGYDTWDDLCGYMDGSAAVIGEMMLPILEPRDAARRPNRLAMLGLAFQLTNFLRDVGEDLDRGRVYLPSVELERFGADPWARRVTPAWRDLMRFQIDRNRALYRRGRRRRGHAAGVVGARHRDGAGAVLPHPRRDRGQRLRRLLAPGPRADGRKLRVAGQQWTARASRADDRRLASVAVLIGAGDHG